ncbi:uncharacterized protein yc1106_08324 [Curvularia clavata]|uniref:Uncharacterized protein n=1 Tax=Curvularia clavata TaxID=95742 RepID=A0A9Q8ZG16_CURCL|nr:uncharacterized protein yc1106_08324 [Curvularia clavata]
MPSPSPMQSFQYKPMSSSHQAEVHDYRQTMYHDKAGVQIAECRRRAGVTRKVEPSTQTYVDFILYPESSIDSSSKAHIHDYSRRALPDMKLGESSKPHVTSAKDSSRSRPKPAIIQRTSESRRMLPSGEKMSSYFSGEPTPPPTPRMLRLPTPELPDLKEAPFCNCGIRGHVVKRCRTCSKEVDL